jgi:hypothetical protein
MGEDLCHIIFPLVYPMVHPHWLSTRRALLICFLGLVLISAFSFHTPTSSYLSFNSFHYHLSPASSSCPSVYDSGRPPINRSALKCHTVPSKISSFELEVCYAKGTCNQFTFHIKRTSTEACREQEATPDPSEDPALTKWMREQRGPDAFYMRTDGAERYASVYSTYEGQCMYSFNIRLKNPGNVYVSIWWTYEVCLSFLGLLELELMKKNIAIHGILRNQCIMASNTFQLS